MRALVDVLKTIDTGSPSRSVAPPGHYAAVLRVADNLGIAIGTDSAGSKVIVAEQTGRFDTIGIDCVAMNVNDVICIGAEPIALVDYLAVERSDPEMLRQIAVGLKLGAEAAACEIPGGELAVLPEVVRGHPSPHGFDIVGTCFGTVALDAMITGEARRPGDVVIGLPSSGIHSNGYTLARRALLEDSGLGLDDCPAELGGASIADALLEPTVIYVRAVLELLRSDIPVHGLAHITGGGVTNLLRLPGAVGYELDDPLAVTPVFGLIAGLRRRPAARDVGGLQHGLRLCRRRAGRTRDSARPRCSPRTIPARAGSGRSRRDAGRLTLPGLGLAATKDGGVVPA